MTRSICTLRLSGVSPRIASDDDDLDMTGEAACSHSALHPVNRDLPLSPPPLARLLSSPTGVPRQFRRHGATEAAESFDTEAKRDAHPGRGTGPPARPVLPSPSCGTTASFVRRFREFTRGSYGTAGTERNDRLNSPRNPTFLPVAESRNGRERTITRRSTAPSR